MRKVLLFTMMLGLMGSIALADGGETCAAPTLIDLTGWTPGSAQNYTDTGTTIGKVNDYTYTNYGCYSNGTGNDVVYQFTPPVDLSLEISLCSSSPTWDSILFVTNGCPVSAGTCVYDDDGCGTLLSVISCYAFTGGTTYYLFVDGYGANGAYTMTIDECYVAACNVTYPFGSVDEAEVCGADTNGGCIMATPAFEPLACSTYYWGSSWFDGSTRDTDWWEITTTNSTRFTIELNAEFQTLFGIAETITPGSGDCADTSGYVNPAFFGNTACTLETGVTGVYPPGTYWIFVAPQFTNNVVCGEFEDYSLRVLCETIAYGACCFGTGSCTDGMTELACTTAGGTYYAGQYCTPINPCPQTIACPPGSLLSQIADPENVAGNAFTSDATLGYAVYEKIPGFITDITDIHWWGYTLTYSGGWLNCSEDPMSFTITFYADNAGEPGAVIQTYTQSVSGVPTNHFLQTFQTYYYSIPTLSPAVSIPTGGWVSIVGNGATCSFLWANSQTGADAGLQWDGAAYTGLLDNTAVCLTGATTTLGACCDPTTGVCTPSLTEAACTTAGGVWHMGLSCDPNPCPQPAPPGDTCASAFTVDLGTLPYVDNRTDHCTFANDCATAITTGCTTYSGYQGGYDIFYTFTPATNMDLLISCIDNIGGGWGGIWVYQGCPCSGTEICVASAGSSTLNATLNVAAVAGTTYYIMIDTYPSPYCMDDFTLTIQDMTPCITCPGGAVLENEPACGAEYVDLYNGGCNSTPVVFQPVACGNTICGQTGTYLVGTSNYRDTDWYSFVVSEYSLITLEVVGEAPMLFQLIDANTGDCSDEVVLNGMLTNYCETGSFQYPVEAGTYWALVTVNAFSGWPCEIPYLLTITCTPDTPPVFCEAPGTMYSSGVTAIAIPDSGCSVPTYATSPITVADTGTAYGVTVRLSMTHTWDSDAYIYLLGSDGTTEVALSTGNGGSGDNYVDTVFDDNAFVSVTSGAAPFTGFYIPEESLAAFNGLPKNGTWTLEICDGAAGDVGTITSWDICFGVAPQLPATGPLGIGILIAALSGLLGLSTLRKK